jgi:uncharacterized protein (DUF2147 family)
MTKSTALVLLATIAGTSAYAADPKGAWFNEDKDGIIQVIDCGGTLCGSVVWLKDPLDPATGKPPVDKKNTDPAQRSRPILGLQVVSGMKPSSSAGKWDGRIYSIDDGKSFDGNLILKGDNEMRVQGCILLICQGETWTRTTLPAAAPAGVAPARPAASPSPQRAR